MPREGDQESGGRVQGLAAIHTPAPQRPAAFSSLSALFLSCKVHTHPVGIKTCPRSPQESGKQLWTQAPPAPVLCLQRLSPPNPPKFQPLHRGLGDRAGKVDFLSHPALLVLAPWDTRPMVPCPLPSSPTRHWVGLGAAGTVTRVALVDLTPQSPRKCPPLTSEKKEGQRNETAPQ